MPLFLWNDSLSVGIKEFDEQHKKLFEVINKLYVAINDGNDALNDILNELVDYTNYHFDCEERFFIRYGYENTNAHIKQHAVLREKTMRLKSNADASNDIITTDVLLFLTDWINKHIDIVDKRYSCFMITNGIK